VVTLKGLHLLIYMRGLRTELVNAFSSYSKRESEGVCECECVGVCSCVGVCVCVWGWELKRGKQKKKKKKKKGGGQGRELSFLCNHLLSKCSVLGYRFLLGKWRICAPSGLTNPVRDHHFFLRRRCSRLLASSKAAGR